MKKIPPKIDTLAIVSMNLPEPFMKIEFHDVSYSLSAITKGSLKWTIRFKLGNGHDGNVNTF